MLRTGKRSKVDKSYKHTSCPHRVAREKNLHTLKKPQSVPTWADIQHQVLLSRAGAPGMSGACCPVRESGSRGSLLEPLGPRVPWFPDPPSLTAILRNLPCLKALDSVKGPEVPLPLLQATALPPQGSSALAQHRLFELDGLLLLRNIRQQNKELGNKMRFL